jgi:hypothetical protein
MRPKAMAAKNDVYLASFHNTMLKTKTRTSSPKKNKKKIIGSYMICILHQIQPPVLAWKILYVAKNLQGTP